MQERPVVPMVLAVDLDGTLLRSDMLFESFWSAFARDWRTPFHALAALRHGRAALKRRLAATARVDAGTLPYDTAVMARIAAWRAGGGRVALVTASEQALAEAVAARVGLFDEVHGSDGRRNLKGAQKAAFLRARYGPGGFAYAGDAPADLPVWAEAGLAITVNASAGLRARAERIAPRVEHLSTVPRGLSAHLAALRPRDWPVDLLAILPALLAAGAPWAGVAAVAAFWLVARSMGLLRDLLRLTEHRAHPRRREGALASGRLPIAHATFMAAALLTLGALVGAALGPGVVAALAGFAALAAWRGTSAGTGKATDLGTRTALNLLRLTGGALAAGLVPTPALGAAGGAIALAVAAVERRAARR